MLRQVTNSGKAFAGEVRTPNMRKSLLLNYSSSVVGHPVCVKITFCKLEVSADFDALSEKKRERRYRPKPVISYEKGVDVVASGALVIRRLLRDNVERRIAGVPAARGRRSAVVIAIVVPRRRVLTFPSSRPIVPGSVGRRAARAFRTLFARADREGAQKLWGFRTLGGITALAAGRSNG